LENLNLDQLFKVYENIDSSEIQEKISKYIFENYYKDIINAYLDNLKEIIYSQDDLKTVKDCMYEFIYKN
jgi:hypothetical protein